MDGSQLGVYQWGFGLGECYCESSLGQVELFTYFGSKRVGSTMPDRLGSYGQFYPWGENKAGNNPADIWSFGTYWRDSFTGLDYANQRYYSNVNGRFMTPDPYKGTSGGPGDPNSPQSWNRYAYVLGDPVNWFDPQGLDNCSPGDPLPCTVTVSGSPLGGAGGGVGDGGSSGTAQGDKGAKSPYPSVQPLNCQQIASGASNGSAFGNLTAALNSAFSSVGAAAADMDQFVQQGLTAAQMTWEFFSGTGAQSRSFNPTSPQSMSMTASLLFANAMAAYLQNPNSPSTQSGVLNFGFTALLAAGVNPTQQFVGSFAFNISAANGSLNVTLTNTTSYSSLMNFVKYFGLTPPTSWSRGDFPIMGNIDQTFNLVIPCNQ